MREQSPWLRLRRLVELLQLLPEAWLAAHPVELLEAQLWAAQVAAHLPGIPLRVPE